MQNEEKVKIVNSIFPVSVHKLEIRSIKDDVIIKTVHCNYYKTTQRIIGKFYKPISYKWKKL